MKRFDKIPILILGLLCAVAAQAQDKEELQKDRDRISKEIQLTTKLIGETRENRNEVEGQLGLIDKKIMLREDLIGNLRKETALFDRQIDKNEAEIARLQSELETLKEQYSAMIRQAQRSNRAEDKLMFLFASEDFFQALRRIRYLRQYSDFRHRQAEGIVRTGHELKLKNQALDSLRADKTRALSAQMSTKQALATDRDNRQRTVVKLKSEEKALIAKLRKQEKQREELNKEISRIIEAEIRASKKDNAGVYSLTPEAAALSADFEKNKGKLPWPVERGVITAGFGQNPHPVLKGITVPNNGIDIATNSGAEVRAVFQGTVSGVFSIPGAGQNVIINHGGYRSVYSHLKETYVSKGEKVTAKQAIGKVLTDESTGKTEAHLEIWKVSSSGTSKQNPSSWIYRQ